MAAAAGEKHLDGTDQSPTSLDVNTWSHKNSDERRQTTGCHSDRLQGL